jgi:hypothetical protein
MHFQHDHLQSQYRPQVPGRQECGRRNEQEGGHLCAFVICAYTGYMKGGAPYDLSCRLYRNISSDLGERLVVHRTPSCR